jgi:hypothetical protein
MIFQTTGAVPTSCHEGRLLFFDTRVSFFDAVMRIDIRGRHKLQCVGILQLVFRKGNKHVSSYINMEYPSTGASEEDETC